MKSDRFYANEMQFSLDGMEKNPEKRSTANECRMSSANEKLLIKMTTQLKLSSGNNSMQRR
jgi:hypothetical protein